jgi:hypothetical protein
MKQEMSIEIDKRGTEMIRRGSKDQCMVAISPDFTTMP